MPTQQSIIKREDGQASVEYAVVLLLVALVLVLSLTPGISGLLDNIGDAFKAALP